MDLLERIAANVVQGRRTAEDEGLDEGLVGQPGVRELVQEAIAAGLPLESIIQKGLSRGMQIVGEKYQRGEYFIPDMLSAAESVAAAMEIIEPLLVGQDRGSKRARVVLATVEQDQHDIGKNLVGIMLRGAGFQVIDLGVGVPAARIAEAVATEGAQIVGLSALLDTTMRFMASTVTELERRGLRSRVRVMIGGAPTSPEFARQIGADAHGSDAFAAVALAEKFAAELVAG
ncbi:MAG: corrinoid protein [Clostridia bacterium]|nr:corrinoid protein [Clostridia bacterium]